MTTFHSPFVRVATVDMLSFAATTFIASGCDPPVAHAAVTAREAAIVHGQTATFCSRHHRHSLTTAAHPCDRSHPDLKESRS